MSRGHPSSLVTVLGLVNPSEHSSLSGGPVEHKGIGKCQGPSPELLGALSGVENSAAEDDSLTLEVGPRSAASGIA